MHRVGALLACLLALAPGLRAESEEALAPPAPDPVTGEQLLRQLPKGISSIVVHKDQSVWWEDGKGTAYRFAPVDVRESVFLVTEIGQLAVPEKLVEANRIDCLEALPALLAAAQAAKLQAADLLVADSILVGVHLSSPQAIVLPEGVLRRADRPLADRSGEIAAVERAADALDKELAASPLDAPGRRCVAELLTRLALQVDHPQESDELPDAFLRRLVASGYLADSSAFSAKSPALAQLQAAIGQAERLQPLLEFTAPSSGGRLRLAELRNAFGEGGWVVSTPARCRFTRNALRPAFHWQPPDLSLVVDLPLGADPAGSISQVLAAGIYHEGQRLAWWTAQGGFGCDADLWRALVPSRGRAPGKNVVTDYLPASIPISDLTGVVAALAVPGGLLPAPRGSAPGEVERFEAAASQALPDAAHLDLIGEYLFGFAYPSPDSRTPLLIGMRGMGGEAEHTDSQTVLGAVGGVMHGDGSDLAELYQVIASRQGRTAHLLQLPAGCGCAWAERKDDGQWHVYLLQSGPAYEFIDHELPAALEKTAKAFSESANFDPDAIQVRLRFPGEDERSPARLSWRIFAEPEYARVMIDVQRDVHFQTFQRGIHKLQKLIFDGDEDGANHHQLAQLFAASAEFEPAAQEARKALIHANDPVSRLAIAIDLVGFLMGGGHPEEAKGEAAEVLVSMIPLVRDRIGSAVVETGIDLIGALHGRADELARMTIHDCMLEQMSSSIERMGEWLHADYNPQVWQEVGRFQELRRLTRTFADAGIQVLTQAGHEKLLTDPTLRDIEGSVQAWLNQVAFRDTQSPGEVMQRYASAGEYYEAILGQDTFSPLLFEKVAGPLPEQYDHAKRIGGFPQMTFDLPWIQISVPYWYHRLAALEAGSQATVDEEQVVKDARRLEDAYAICTRMGLQDRSIDLDHHLGRLILALVTRDKDLVRERLHEVALRKDREFTNATADLLGSIARFQQGQLPWYKEVLVMWRDEGAGKQTFFRIAWKAALAGNSDAALAMAEIAAATFKDDPSFDEEYAFMKRLYAPVAPKDP